MEGTSRRLAAVWFADIVGFTSLASRDEAAAVGLIQFFQETTGGAIDRHGGTLVEFTGDGVLAYATSTADALDTIVDVMAGFREGSRSLGEPALLRAGMHVGDLVVASDGERPGHSPPVVGEAGRRLVEARSIAILHPATARPRRPGARGGRGRHRHVPTTRGPLTSAHLEPMGGKIAARGAEGRVGPAEHLRVEPQHPTGRLTRR